MFLNCNVQVLYQASLLVYGSIRLEYCCKRQTQALCCTANSIALSRQGFGPGQCTAVATSVLSDLAFSLNFVLPGSSLLFSFLSLKPVNAPIRDNLKTPFKRPFKKIRSRTQDDFFRASGTLQKCVKKTYGEGWRS